MDDRRIVLASASPRRRELLRLLNIPFEVTATDIEEIPKPNESAADMVWRLSRAKAEAALRAIPDSIVIAADTDGDLDGTILGKPLDSQDAVAMLRALRGRGHTVYGAVTVGSREELETFVVCTRVWMRDYTDAEIAAYVSTDDPLDKAAAYGVQDQAFNPVQRVEGCFSNVMGLPLCRLYGALKRHVNLLSPAIECHRHPEEDCTVAELVGEGRLTRP